MQYSIEPRTRKCIKGSRFLSFTRNLSKKYKKQLLDIGLGSLKNASKKGIHKTGEFLRNKIAKAVTNSHDDKIVKTKPVEEITIPQVKIEEN